MKILGIILEINPFHNGHQYFIEEAIKMVNPDVVIAITSTSFTMRGDASLLTKFDKTKILLNNNVDLVVELPVAKTLNSADFFAYHSIEILSKFGITDLAFGIEDGRIDYLNKIIKLTNTKEFNDSLAINLDNRLSYKNAFSEAFNTVCFDNELITYLNKPNFTLALQYLKAIDKLNLSINVHPIKRIDNFYQNTSIDFMSAYTIREMLNNNQDVSKYLPYNPNILKTIDKPLLFNLIKYKFHIDRNIPQNHLITEGIDNYIINNLQGNNLDECINFLANKRYTKSRIKRIMISSLLNISSSYNQFEAYYRILGFNDNGRNYLKTLNENIKKTIKTTLKNDLSLTGQIELEATKLYDLLINNDLTIEEYKIPIKKENKQ